jgi:hypothetical protein
MSQQSLDAFFDKLVRVLLKDLGFFIPRSIIPEIMLEKITIEIPEHFFDELFYLDVKNGMMFFDINEFNLRLVEKPMLFEKNIIQLLNKKKEIGEAEFDYILEKYFKNVEFYANVVSWLGANLVDCIKGKADILAIGAFELQFKLYKSHFQELIRCFYKEKEVQLIKDYDYYELFETYLPDFLSRLGVYHKELVQESVIEFPNSISEVLGNNQEVSLKSNPTSKKKLKKEPLLTDKEVEDFILSSVFNVKLN